MNLCRRRSMMIGKWTGPDGIERDIKINPMTEKRLIFLTGLDVEILSKLLWKEMERIRIDEKLTEPNDQIKLLLGIHDKVLDGHFDFGVNLDEYQKEMDESINSKSKRTPDRCT